ncbi:MAG TPA: hypothetical protein VM764_11490, partial [Gemmatimonadaceae bacterium]|nr:hypothetical protein [Gemmatimonadaceae bacterium]
MSTREGGPRDGVRDGNRRSAGERTLETPVNFLTGIGPRRAELLKKLNIFTARDLLLHVPHRYEDASTVSPIARLRVGEDATVIGTVISKGILPTRKGLRVFQAVVQDSSGLIEAGWPGQPWLDRQIQKGDVLLLSGPVRFFHGRQLSPREFVNLGPEADGTLGGRVLAVYPATEGLSFKVIRGLIDQHLDTLLPAVEEYLPPELLAEAGVPPLPQALRAVHRPATLAEAYARRARPQHRTASARRHQVREQEGPHLQAARGAAVHAPGRAGAVRARDLRRHVRGAAHASPAARRRRQRQDGGRALRRPAGDGERLPGGVHGADGT